MYLPKTRMLCIRCNDTSNSEKPAIARGIIKVKFICIIPKNDLIG